ncbi:MAG: hypothetical protein LBS02_18365 [Hungatella sp.]|jgi:hypothetical protein|nr:hypothetical protein [Hungatella sp.]
MSPKANPITILEFLGKIVEKPFKIRRTAREPKELACSLKSLYDET